MWTLCLCVCALHLSLVPLSPPDIPLPVTAAWRFQIRPSSTFFLPVIALYAIQHQFHPTEINPTDNSLPPKWIMASPHFSTKTEVCGWKAVSVWRISTLSMGWSMWRSDSSLLLILSEWPQILSEHGSISCNLLCLMHIVKVHQGFSNEPGRGSVRKGLLKQLIKWARPIPLHLYPCWWGGRGAHS